MRIGLLIVAAVALAAFLAVAVVLPRMAVSEAHGAAQVLIAGTQSAQHDVSATAEKAGSLAGAGKGVKLSPKNDPEHGEMKVGRGGAWNAMPLQNRTANRNAWRPSARFSNLGFRCCR